MTDSVVLRPATEADIEAMVAAGAARLELAFGGCVCVRGTPRLRPYLPNAMLV